MIGQRSDCPHERAWLEIATGSAVYGASESSRLLAHAAECDHCGPLLAQAIRLMDISVERPVKQSGRAAWIGIAATLAIGAGIGLYRAQLTPAETPLALLARGAAVRRAIEWRVPGAAHQTIATLRGSSDDSPEMKQAELALARQGSAAGLDRTVYLQAKGRLEILRGNGRQALFWLEQASGPLPPDFDIDLGIAYGLTGENAKLGLAMQSFDRALAAAPGNLAAKFNRALARERLGDWRAATADWQSYLTLDGTGGWADEARRHLEKARAR